MGAGARSSNAGQKVSSQSAATAPKLSDHSADKRMLLLAAMAPERLCALVLDGAPAVEGLMTRVEADEVPVDALLRALREQGIQPVRRMVAQHPLMQLRSADSAAHQLLGRMIDDYRGDDLASRAYDGTQPSLRLHAIQTPVLALNGAHDTARRRANGDAYCSRLPRCERALIPDAGHLPNLDNPDSYNAVLIGFFRRHAP